MLRFLTLFYYINESLSELNLQIFLVIFALQNLIHFYLCIDHNELLKLLILYDFFLAKMKAQIKELHFGKDINQVFRSVLDQMNKLFQIYVEFCLWLEVDPGLNLYTQIKHYIFVKVLLLFWVHEASAKGNCFQNFSYLFFLDLILNLLFQILNCFIYFFWVI